MAMEIERKFRLRTSKVLRGRTGVRMFQAYLARGAMTVRIRLHSEQATLTLKGPSENGACVECEYPVPLADAQQMTALPGVTSLSKTRYCIDYEGHVFEVDQYHGVLEGLFTVEAELDAVDEELLLPAWVGEELTGRPGWSNRKLASMGLPPDALLLPQ